MNAYVRDPERRAVILRVLRRADAIVALTAPLARVCSTLLSQGGIAGKEPIIIPQSVSPPPKPWAGRCLTTVLGVPDSSKVVLVPAGLRRVKRPWALIAPLAARVASVTSAKADEPRPSSRAWTPSAASPVVLVMVGPRLDEEVAESTQRAIDAANLKAVSGSSSRTSADASTSVSHHSTMNRQSGPVVSSLPTTATTTTTARPSSSSSSSSWLSSTSSTKAGEAASSAFRAFLFPPVNRPHLLAWMQDPRCAAVCNCSEAEGQSNAVLEAMASGAPVVVSDVPGNQAVVEHGKTGFVEASDAAIAARALDLCMAGPPAEIVAAARGETTSGRFSPGVEAAAWRTLLDRVCAW